MHWWMSWYWDSHEPEIRLALSNLYGNCEDTMDEIFHVEGTPNGRSVFREWQQRKNSRDANQSVTEDMKTIHHSFFNDGDRKEFDEDITSNFRKAFVETFTS